MIDNIGHLYPSVFSLYLPSYGVDLWFTTDL